MAAEPTPKSAADPAARRGRSGWLRRLVTVVSLLYAAVVVGLCLLLYLGGDRWWVATLLLFGPRWPWALPLALLVPTAAACRWRLLGLLGAVSAVLVFPLMGLCVPRAALVRPPCRGPMVRVLTCNVHDRDLNPEALAAVVVAAEPDVVVLQSWSPRYLPVVFPSRDWHVHEEGQLCLASRYPIHSGELLDDPDFNTTGSAAGRYEVETPAGTVVFVSLHLGSPRDGLEEVIHSRGRHGGQLAANSGLRRRQSAKIERWLDPTLRPLLLAGDFNTPPESTIYRRYWGRYANAFSSAGLGFGPTHLTRHTGVRIDHILAGPGWHCERCWVGPPVGSPHRPVLADLCRDGSTP